MRARRGERPPEAIARWGPKSPGVRYYRSDGVLVNSWWVSVEAHVQGKVTLLMCNYCWVEKVCRNGTHEAADFIHEHEHPWSNQGRMPWGMKESKDLRGWPVLREVWDEAEGQHA